MAKKNEKVKETSAAVENEETVTVASEEETCKDEALQKAVDEVNEYKDIVKRLQAEFENYRKRTNDSVKIAREDGGNDIIYALLPVVDAVDNAIKIVTDDKSVAGINLIRKQFSNLFEKYGVSELPAEGEEFNPEFHNAVMQEDDAENAGKVTEVLQKGYVRNGKVIRYSMVKVAK